MNEAAVLRATMTDSGTFFRKTWTGTGWKEETVYENLACALSRAPQAFAPRLNGEWEAVPESDSRLGLFLPVGTVLQAGDRAEIVRQGQVFRGICGPGLPYLSHCYATFQVQEVGRA